MDKSRRVKYEGHVTSVGNTKRIGNLAVKRGGKTPFRRPK
jgi:hypothetical protein